MFTYPFSIEEQEYDLSEYNPHEDELIGDRPVKKTTKVIVSECEISH